MKKWLIGIGTTLCIALLLLAGLYGLYKWESRDLSSEEWHIKRAESMGRAVEHATKKLPEYAKTVGLKPTDFTGPYIKIDRNNIEWPTQTVAYKNDKYYFFYDQLSNNTSLFDHSKEDCHGKICKWLDSMP